MREPLQTAPPRGLIKDPRLNVTIASCVLEAIMHTIGALPPETGGLLLGQIDRNDITHFHFDSGARCTGSTYTPDHIGLRKRMRERWLPNSLDMKGFVHSHPRHVDRLSSGDLSYITRLLKANDDMDRFVAPIILPHEFRFCVFVIMRERPRTPLLANVTLF